MIDKTRWLGLGPWHEDNESELIDWTAQPQYKGLVKGDYYHAELRYSGRWGDPGHKGELDVVFDDDGKIAFAEFNAKGKSTWERAEGLIAIAHPQFREELIAEAEKMHIWRRSNKR